MFDITFKTIVEVPQLSTLTVAMNQLGEKLMAGFEQLASSLSILRDEFQTLEAVVAAEATQISDKLQQLATILEQDLTDQANVDSATAMVQDLQARAQAMQASVAAFVPDEAPPAPEA